MRVLVAPDKFAGTLTAVEAADAIAAGWRQRAPDDELDLAPMADGGTGFVDVMHAALGGELLAVTVEGPFGTPTPATVLHAGDTAYVETAQACGIQLTKGEGAELATTLGVGELLLAAVGTGATTVVLGLGGSGTNDGGAGLLAALGATSDGLMDVGSHDLGTVSRVDLGPARERVAGVRLVAATDVDARSRACSGRPRRSALRRGSPRSDLPRIDGILEGFARATDHRTSLEPGAGAAGGLGFALLLLGATRVARHRPRRGRGAAWPSGLARPTWC